MAEEDDPTPGGCHAQPDSEKMERASAGDDGAELTKESFFQKFRTEHHGIQQDLAATVAGADGSGIHQALDELLGRVRALEGAFTCAAHLLPAYDVQQYRSQLKGLDSEIAAKREHLAPRRKFQFKRRQAVPDTAANATAPHLADQGKADAGAGAVAATGSSAAAPGIAAGSFAGELFEGLSGVAIGWGASELDGKDVTLRSLEGCRVLLLGRVGALHCHGLRRCEVFVGAVGSSALLYDCRECVLTLAAKQFRLHDSECILLHLHTLSNPVIEHSRRVLFAPYDLSYDDVAGHWDEAALGKPPGSSASPMPCTWAEVQDFNWHKRQASPNWCIVPAELRRAPVAVAHSAAEAATSDPLPPSLAELERCRSCWDAAEAGTATDNKEAAVETVLAAPASDSSVGKNGVLGPEDEF